MATYRVQRLFSKWEELNDWSARVQHKHPKLTHYSPIGDQAEEALEEAMRTGKTGGKKAKRFIKNHTIYEGAALGTSGALLGASVGGKKGAAIGGLSGAGIGAGLGYGSAKLADHIAAKRGKHKNEKMGGYRTDRWLDNMDVADGKMSEEDFNKKWKKS